MPKLAAVQVNSPLVPSPLSLMLQISPACSHTRAPVQATAAICRHEMIRLTMWVITHRDTPTNSELSDSSIRCDN